MVGMVSQDRTSAGLSTAWLYVRTISCVDTPDHEDSGMPYAQSLVPLLMCVRDSYRHQSHMRPIAEQR